MSHFLPGRHCSKVDLGRLRRLPPNTAWQFVTIEYGRGYFMTRLFISAKNRDRHVTRAEARGGRVQAYGILRLKRPTWGTAVARIRAFA